MHERSRYCRRLRELSSRDKRLEKGGRRGVKVLNDSKQALRKRACVCLICEFSVDLFSFSNKYIFESMEKRKKKLLLWDGIDRSIDEELFSSRAILESFIISKNVKLTFISVFVYK